MFGGITGLVGGHSLWAGAIGGVSALINNWPSGPRVVSAYYKIEDFNAIPDDLVASGQPLKFYPGSISGIATNRNHPLLSTPSRTILEGTLRNGFMGTFGLDDVDGVTVGDYVYAPIGIEMGGDPDSIIKELLCGSNIDYPYRRGTFITSKPPHTRGGQAPIDYVQEGDFADGWEAELTPYKQFALQKLISPSDDTSPFEEVKSLVKDMMFSFYVNEANKFAIRTIRPHGLNLGTAQRIATYTEGINILDNFSFTRGVDEAAAGVRFYYDYVGREMGGLKDGYAKLLEVPFTDTIYGETEWHEIKSQWIHRDPDAKVIAYRMRMDRAHGIDNIDLPTTLYGVIHNITDLIRVTHSTGSLTSRLFEILGYEKRFDEGLVDLHAVDAQRTYGYGNCRWSGTYGEVDGTTQSGAAVIGQVGTVRTIATLVGTFHSWQNSFEYEQPYLGGFTPKSAYICFGSTDGRYSEFMQLLSMDVKTYPDPFSEDPPEPGGANTINVRRGMFNTTRRTYFAGEKFYLLGWVSKHKITAEPVPTLIAGSTCRLATTFNINPIIGSAFVFF